MDRRNALKNILIASGGLITLPAWANGWNLKDLPFHTPSFSTLQQDVLASVTDTIIPAGNSIGALSVGVDKFLQKLIDDCYEKDIQENVKLQLDGLEASAQSANGKSFISCDQNQRQVLLLKLSTSELKSEKDFFTLIKSETIRGFNTSQEVMVKYLNYRMAPGHYYGCVDVKA